MATPDGVAARKTAANRGRPRRISQEQIVAAVIAIGLDRFTMQGIAERLGVTTPALYTHVRGRSEVLDLVTADLVGRFDVPFEGDHDWRDWLVRFGLEARRHFAGTDTLAPILSGPLAAGRLTAGRRGLELLAAEGFTPGDAGRALWLVFRIGCTAGPAGAASVGAPMAEARRAGGETMPLIERAIEEITSSPEVDTLEFDLRTVVAGLEQRLIAG